MVVVRAVHRVRDGGTRIAGPKVDQCGVRLVGPSLLHRDVCEFSEHREHTRSRRAQPTCRDGTSERAQIRNGRLRIDPGIFFLSCRCIREH